MLCRHDQYRKTNDPPRQDRPPPPHVQDAHGPEYGRLRPTPRIFRRGMGVQPEPPGRRCLERLNFGGGLLPFGDFLFLLRFDCIVLHIEVVRHNRHYEKRSVFPQFGSVSKQNVPCCEQHEDKNTALERQTVEGACAEEGAGMIGVSGQKALDENHQEHQPKHDFCHCDSVQKDKSEPRGEMDLLEVVDRLAVPVDAIEPHRFHAVHPVNNLST